MGTDWTKKTEISLLFARFRDRQVVLGDYIKDEMPSFMRTFFPFEQFLNTFERGRLNGSLSHQSYVVAELTPKAWAKTWNIKSFAETPDGVICFNSTYVLLLHGQVFRIVVWYTADGKIGPCFVIQGQKRFPTFNVQVVRNSIQEWVLSVLKQYSK